jgi:FlaA1/EpsC-like NDP-sugar epimerase
MILNKLIRLNRLTKQLVMVFVDSIAVILILLLAFSIRLGNFYWPSVDIYWTIFSSPLIAIPIFYSFNLYRSVLRYIGAKAILAIGQAVSLYAVIWGLVLFVVDVDFIPRSVIFINWMLCFLAISGYRVFSQILFNKKFKFGYKRKINIMIYGAGSAGRQLASALQGSIDYKNVGYIDDNIALQGGDINGIQVFPNNKVDELVSNKNVSEIFIALPFISIKKRNKIFEILKNTSVVVKILPSISDIAQGVVKIEDLRQINVKDLLGRDSVKPNKNLLKTNIFNKNILVTGAGGSIGSELCRQILLLKPKKLILFDISESALYQIDQEIANLGIENIEVLPVLGSVGDSFRISNVFQFHEVQTVYHAAAYKHVPLVEYNPSQGVLNNSIGTMIAAQAAIASNVETFVLISTDKAVRPTNTMGVSKRVAELILQALAIKPNHNTCLTMVRFGNVLDSSGSVIPLFKKQIKEGGPITVTDVNVVRYFMTIPEAVELVIQAGAMSAGGDVFVLHMGEPIKIYDLAVKMINLSGLQVLDKENPDGDIEIKYTGLRPGEKLYEELLVGNNVNTTDNKLIMRAQEEMIDWEKLEPKLNELKEASINNDTLKIREILLILVPEFNPNYPIL